MTDKNANAPEELTDSDLEQVDGGFKFGKTYDELNPLATTLHFEDNEPVRKVVLAQASDSGNVAGSGGAPTPTEYTFGEDLGNDIIPVTYKLID